MVQFEADPADAAYQAIRASTTDVARIARRTGLKATNIRRIKRRIKEHLFSTPHLLDRYEELGIPAEYRLFDSDSGIAAAWKRLEAGSFTARDRQLLRHEMAEAWYMQRHGPSYTAAHEAASRRFPAPSDE